MDEIEYCDLDKQIIIKQLEDISDKELSIILLKRQYEEIQNSCSYKIGIMINKIINFPVDMFKNLIKFFAKIVYNFPWLINFIKKVIHLIPNLEVKILSVIDPSSVNTTKEKLVLTEDGQKIYDELMMRIEKQK